MAYTSEVIAEKNITLSFEFERYLLENPDILQQLPDGVEVFLLPKDDPELYRINLEAAQQRIQAGESVIYIEIEAVKPSRSRLVNPRLTYSPSFTTAI